MSIKQFVFFNWLSNVKNLVLLNGSEHLRNVIQWHKNSFSFQKITKNRPTAGGLAPRPPKPSAAGGPAPRPLVCDLFELHKLSQHISKVKYLHFSSISLSLLLCKILVTCQQATISDLPSYDIFFPTSTFSVEKF